MISQFTPLLTISDADHWTFELYFISSQLIVLFDDVPYPLAPGVQNPRAHNDTCISRLCSMSLKDAAVIISSLITSDTCRIVKVNNKSVYTNTYADPPYPPNLASLLMTVKEYRTEEVLPFKRT